MDTNEETEKSGEWKLTAAGLALTVLWLAFIGIYAVRNWGHIRGLEANAFGDFLAGTFAPLAFLWLVLGFFQQGYELRNSARALWLQGRELQHSVEQQRELVKATREQLEFDSKVLEQQVRELQRSTQPILRLEAGGNMSSGPGMRLYQFRLMNYGKACSDVQVTRVGGGVLAKSPNLSGGGHLSFNLELGVNGQDALEVTPRILTKG